ncbi:hypothetical protein RDWZM_004906 [Blomia tropicalis]|uniref:Protein kinase domain-containing protein n=1 Tax=Blomia tropicalis TaxID=40697 RepID=A0A9Q0M529_BLOTA|nr:hypothetical protein BLOT_014289 [Blomia tropicalis]KAJ6219094.1 hypothetical protein RDWZM_004906 [Blomia tropicalis]
MTEQSSKPVTRFFQVPSADQRFKTKEDVIRAFGYKLMKKLDEGGFGTVFIAKDRRKNCNVACKWMDLGPVNSNDPRMEDTRNELMVLEQVRHPYVIKVLCHFIVQTSTNNNMYIFMELANGGNLSSYIKRIGLPDETMAKKYFAQVLCGIGHMHAYGIAHRDIKMANVLLVENPRSISGDYLLLISDFGLSKQVKVENRMVSMSDSICGTPAYMSPELLQRKQYDAYQADVWALGVTLYEMMTLQLPFDVETSEDEMAEAMIKQQWKWNDKLKQYPPSSSLDDLMHSMLNPDPSKRLRLVKIMIHEWVLADYNAAHRLSDQIKAEQLNPQTNSQPTAKNQPTNVGDMKPQ